MPSPEPSRPLRVLGLGGAARPGSSTEKALACALAAARAAGADTQLLGGDFIAALPVFDPRTGAADGVQATLVEAVQAADGIILASPGYHGSLSGAVKNALDTLELTREGPAPYLEGKAVGVVVTAAGWQAAGTVLTSMRTIVHALRGWPTPYGAALNTAEDLFDPAGACRHARDAWQLETVARQVCDFAAMRARVEMAA